MHLGGAQLGTVPPRLGDNADHAALARSGIAADGDPLAHQGKGCDLPALALLPEPVGVGDAYVGEEDLVELGLPGELAQRPHVDPGVGHVTDEVAQAGVLRDVGVGPDQEDREPCLVGRRCPHFLPVDDPAVTVAHRAGADRGEVGAGTGFAEQLTPDLLAGPQWLEEALLLLVGAEGEDGGCCHAQSDPVASRVVVRCAADLEELVDVRLEGAR